MSIKPVDQFPGKVAPATPDNPFGTARNITIPGDGTGTPWESSILKDEWGFQHAMLLNAGMEPNGTPDSAENSQLFEAAKASIGNGANLLSNHNFLIASPDDSQPPPDATPRSYPPGFQIFSGVFANETTGITDLTYINGRVSFTAGDFYIPRANSKELENITEFVASVADFDGKPRTRGVSYALVGDEYRVTVGVDALEDTGAVLTPLGSVKFEQGSFATTHSVVANPISAYDIRLPLLGSRDTRFVVDFLSASIRYGINEEIPLDDQLNFFRGLNSPDAWGDPSNIGTGSSAFGRNGASVAYLSTTFGHDCSVYGAAGTAGGAGSCVGNPDQPSQDLTYGYCGFAHGKNTHAQGRAAFSLGENNAALSDYSESTGRQCISAAADPSHPDYVASDGLYAISKGRRAYAYGDEAVAIGVAVTSYNGAQTYGSGINTGTPLVNSTPNSLALGRNVDVATVKLFGGNGTPGDFGKIGINTNEEPDDLVEINTKAGETISVMLPSTSATPTKVRLGAKVAGVGRGIFDIQYTHPNAGQPYGKTTLLQNEVEFAEIDELGVMTFSKPINLPSAGLKVLDTRVVGGQQSAISDSVGGDEQGKINGILQALRNHGLIAT